MPIRCCNGSCKHLDGLECSLDTISVGHGGECANQENEDSSDEAKPPNLIHQFDATRQSILNLLDQMEESNGKACKEISGAETITFDDQRQFNGLAVTNNAIREVRKRIKELF